MGEVRLVGIHTGDMGLAPFWFGCQEYLWPPSKDHARGIISHAL